MTIALPGPDDTVGELTHPEVVITLIHGTFAREATWI